MGHCNLKAEFGQSLHQAAFHLILVETFEEVSAELPVMFLVFEHLVGSYQQAVGYSKQGAFLASPSRYAPELSGKVGLPRKYSLKCPEMLGLRARARNWVESIARFGERANDSCPRERSTLRARV